MNNKGQSLGLGALVSVGIVFVVVTMLFAFGADVTSDVRDDFTAGTYEYNITGDGLEGMSEIPAKLPTLGKVVIAVIIIGLLIAGFGRLTGRI